LSLAKLCLFLSGAAGLVYEIVWLRYLALFLGHTSYAIVAVLAAFMGGLALGNWWLGRWADRTPRPLALYGWLEIAIGLYALAFPYYYALCDQSYVALARAWQLGAGGGLALKFGFSLLAILLPTTLMGGTLPVLTRLVTRSLGELQQRLASLYAVNSAGAVAGIALADFWWIPAVGLEATVIASAALNLTAGGLGLFFSGWRKEGSGAADAPQGEAGDAPAATAPASERYSPAQIRLAIVAIGLSGFAAMLYQVAWTRVLSLALGSSTHAFSIMLITFIAGLAMGAWLVARWRAGVGALRAFAWAELALAATLGLSMFAYGFLPYWFARLAALLARTPEAYPLYVLVQGLLCVGVMFVPTVCLGLTLPLVSRVATSETARTGGSVGRVFAMNTLGTVLGTALTGLVFLPWLGLARTFSVGVALNVVIGLAILGCLACPGWRRLAWSGPVIGAVLVWLAGPVFDRTWRGALTLGLWRQQEPPASWREFHEIARTADIRYYRDGAGATVSIHGMGTNDALRFLKVNGKTDASTGGDMNTQVLLGHVPMLLHPQPAQVLIVGLGSGVTAGAVAAHPLVQRIEVVEISPEVVAGARWFRDHNRHALEDPRLRLVVDDAKSFLQVAARQYQVIISEPSNPWMAGVAGVFSREFYEQCRAHLAPGGLMAQWVQLYEFSDETFDMVLATFSSAFPHVGLWQTHVRDVLLVGSVEPPSFDLDLLVARLAQPAVKADLERIQVTNPVLLLVHEAASPALGALIPPADTRLHSDFYPVLEYAAQRDFFSRRAAHRFRMVDENFSRRPGTLLGRYLERHPPTPADCAALARFNLPGNMATSDLVPSVLLRWQQESPDSLEPWEMANRLKPDPLPGELDALRLAPLHEPLLARAPSNPTLLRQYGLALMRLYLAQRSCFFAPPADELTRVLDSLVLCDPDHQRLYQVYLAELAWDRGDDQTCLALARLALLSDLPRGVNKFQLDPSAQLLAVTRIADVQMRRGECKAAAELCEQALQAGYVTDELRREALPFDVTRRRALLELSRATAKPPGAQATPDTATRP
jgi:spermidine synthase